MKTHLWALIIASLVLTGCGKKNNSQSQSQSSEPTPSGEYGFDYYDGYYGELTWSNGDDLKQKLHDIIRNGYTALSFNKPGKTNWETNAYADHIDDDFEYLDVVYSATNYSTSSDSKTIQREHAFAASLMTGSGTADAVKFLGRATDFHNLFASAAGANGSRGNKNYGVADKNSASYTDRTTSGGNDGYSFDPKNFEPGNIDKGRLARAIFYMGTMYKDDEVDTVNNVTMKGLTIVEEYVNYVAGNNCRFAIGNLSALLDWNNTYEVDYLEMQHNESVYSHVLSVDNAKQGNRNPFVDYPSLVDYVYGDKKNQSGSLGNCKPSCLDLGSNKNEHSHYAIKTAKRDFTYGETLTASDFAIYDINKNYSFTDYDGELTHSFLNHTFEESDGESVNAIITIGEQEISYSISLDPIKKCSFHSEMKKDGIDNSYEAVGTDNNVSYGGLNFTINITVDYGTASTSNKWTLQDKSDGGFLMGSGTYRVTKVVITSVNSYSIDEVYMSARAGNATSSYSLKIKVGEEQVYSGNVNKNDGFVTMGKRLDETKTGKITYTFEGANCLRLQYIAFNVVE